MRKTFYGNSFNSHRKKINAFNPFNFYHNKSNSFNNKNNFEGSRTINLNNNINNLEITKNDNKGNKKEETGYIFYGKNKLFKTINKNITSYIISSKIKRKILKNNLEEKNINKKEGIQLNNLKSKNIEEYQKQNRIKIKRQFSSDILLNDINKNYGFSGKCKNDNFKDKNTLIKDNLKYFPNIYGLNNKNNKNELNYHYNINYNNDKNIQFDQLNQLHKNFINSIKNPSKLFQDKEIINNFSSDFHMNEIIKNKNNNLEVNNNSQKWFNINSKNNINEYIIKKYRDEKIEKIKHNDYMKINSNNRFSKFNLSKRNINSNSPNNFKKNNNESWLKNSNFNNMNISNDSHIKKNSIKINIKNHLKNKENSLDINKSKSSSSFSINFSNDTESDNKNVKNEYENNNINNRINNENKPNIVNYQDSNFKAKDINFKNKNKFIFPSKDKNFSFRSTKNMKIEENNNYSKNLYNKTKENENSFNKDKKEENSNVKYNFKTSFYFYSTKFENNKKENITNIENIINNVIENNRKAAQARVSNSFYNLGKNYLNNKMRNSQKNFYKNNNYYYSGDTNFAKDQNKDENNINSNKRKFNCIQLSIMSPDLWRKHEEVWVNILNKNYNDKYENFILPPNDTDILISSYIKMFPMKLNIYTYSKINSISQEEKEFLNFCIDDDIQNPKNEIKKWKNVYKKMIFRWHPDKLFPLLKELNIKNEYIKKEIERRSSLIINNINLQYQNIVEILKKIILYKEKCIKK